MTMTGKKFCLFMFFGIFATHLVYLGELSQIKYTAVKNKSLHYRWFIFAFPSNIWFFYKIDLRIAIPVDADFLIYYLVSLPNQKMHNFFKKAKIKRLFSQWRDQYLHHDANQSEIFRNRTKIVGSYYYKAGNQPPDVTRKKPIAAITKVLLVTSNPRSGSSYTGKKSMLYV